MKIINHNVASENNNDNLVNEVVAKDHINVEKESGPNLVSEVVAKHDIHDDWMVKLLECPICFNVPRDLPIPACPAGHIICKKCKSTVTTCPTCRRRLYNDGTNSLAASMIDKVPHRCKFAEYGCEVKDFLCQLKIHEEKCEERTVKCPYISCLAEVQLKAYKDHAFKDCSSIVGSIVCPVLSIGFMQWDGVSKNRGKEFDLNKAQSWKLGYSKDGDVFKVVRYIPSVQSLVIALFMARDPKEVEQYSAKLTIYKESLKTSYECSIIPIEQYPSEEDFPNHEKCWNVHYSLFRKLFNFEDKGKNNNHDWVVNLNLNIEIKKKTEV